MRPTSHQMSAVRPERYPTPSANAAQDRRRVGFELVAVASLAAAAGLPYALRGPGFLLDDWVWLRNRRFGGLLATGGGWQVAARPGAWLIDTLQFGAIGAHPLPLYLLQLALNVCVAVAIVQVLRPFVGRLAIAVALMWVLLPNHSSLTRWLTAASISVSLLLLLLGIDAVRRSTVAGAPVWRAVLLLCLAGLCYEATIPAACVVALIVPILVTGRPRWRLTLAAWLPLVLIAGWMLLHTPKHVDRAWLNVDAIFSSHFGSGLTPFPRAAPVLALGAAFGIGATVGRLVLSSWRSQTGTAERLVVAGLAAIAVGMLGFARFPNSFVGFDDRVNVVASVGAAMVWTGLLAQLWRWRIGAVVIACAWLIAVLPLHVRQDRDYARAGGDAIRILDAVIRTFPREERLIVVGPYRPYRHDVPVLYSYVDAAPALQLEVAPTTANFDRFAPATRFDLRQLSSAG
jgi:hypothetical protein